MLAPKNTPLSEALCKALAQVVASSGRTVLLHDAVPGAVERALETTRRSLEKLAAKGADLDPDAVIERVEPVEDIEPADLMANGEPTRCSRREPCSHPIPHRSRSPRWRPSRSDPTA